MFGKGFELLGKQNEFGREIFTPIYFKTRPFQARTIHSTVIKTENISSYETGTQKRELTCSTGGSLGNF